MRLEVQRKQFQSVVHEKSPRLAVTMIHSPEKLESLTDATADGLLTLYFSAYIQEDLGTPRLYEQLPA